MNFLHFAVFLFAVCTVILVLVSLATPAQGDEKLAGLTFATADVPHAEGAELPPGNPAWKRKDVWLSILLATCVAAVWIYFNG